MHLIIAMNNQKISCTKNRCFEKIKLELAPDMAVATGEVGKVLAFPLFAGLDSC